MPKYLITLKELSPSDVEWDRGDHGTVEYRRPTRHASIVSEYVVTPADASEMVTLKAAILTAIADAESI